MKNSLLRFPHWCAGSFAVRGASYAEQSRRAIPSIGVCLAIVVAATCSTGCNPAVTRRDGVAPQRPAPQPREVARTQTAPMFQLPLTDIVNPLDEPQRWLTVEAQREGTQGGWATGSFDPKRNKITIRTNDVTRFAVDVARIAIDWERPVILGIDGRNSELRRREVTYLHFRRGDGRGWVVEE